MHTAIDVFSGAGGLSLGLQQAGFNVLLANEIVPVFASTYQANHPDTRVMACDIHTIDFAAEARLLGLKPGSLDLFCGGPPCQGFSTVGAKNEKDNRNSLFYEYLRAVSELRPKYLIFENVAGFKTMYEGKAYRTLLEELETLGYSCLSGVLEASDFGLPQVRKRTIVVGWRKELPKPVMPRPTHASKSNLFSPLPKTTLMEAIGDLPQLDANDQSDRYGTAPGNDYQRAMRGDEAKLTLHTSTNYGDKMKRILSLIPPGGCVLDLPEELRPAKYFNNTYARLVPDRPSPTITRNFGTPSSSRCVHPHQNRALSTREGARLQGFPDSYRFLGGKTAQNLQIGNAVPPLFGKIIAEAVLQALQSQH
jgi:DNA (cytosine-5)-methyltransferase 1